MDLPRPTAPDQPDCQEMTGFKDKSRAVDTVYSASSKAVDSILQYLY